MKSRLIRYASLGGALLLWIVFGFVNAEFKFINPVMIPSPKDVARAGWELKRATLGTASACCGRRVSRSPPSSPC
jgi:ABC-type nitrate/sulfonate/bicarbonate transport system permease component